MLLEPNVSKDICCQCRYLNSSCLQLKTESYMWYSHFSHLDVRFSVRSLKKAILHHLSLCCAAPINFFSFLLCTFFF